MVEALISTKFLSSVASLLVYGWKRLMLTLLPPWQVQTSSTRPQPCLSLVVRLAALLRGRSRSESCSSPSTKTTRRRTPPEAHPPRCLRPKRLSENTRKNTWISFSTRDKSDFRQWKKNDRSTNHRFAASCSAAFVSCRRTRSRDRSPWSRTFRLLPRRRSFRAVDVRTIINP